MYVVYLCSKNVPIVDDHRCKKKKKKKYEMTVIKMIKIFLGVEAHKC